MSDVQRPAATTELIRERTRDSVLQAPGLAEIRASLRDNPDPNAVIEWAKAKCPGLIPLLTTSYPIDKWGFEAEGGRREGVKLDAAGRLDPAIRADILNSLGLDEPTVSRQWSWNFRMEDASMIKKAIDDTVASFGGTIEYIRDYKPGFSGTHYLEFKFSGPPALRTALLGMGKAIRCRDSNEWKW